MAEEGQSGPRVVSLNEVVELLGALSSSQLKGVLTRGFEDPQTLAAGCTGLCDCHGRYCACYGNVSSVAQERMSFPEFMQLREGRIQELREELAALEVPKELGS